MENLRASVASHIRAARTPAEELRVTLGRLEAQVGKLGHGDKEEPVELLLALDRAAALLDELEEQGTSLSGERGRFETMVQQYRRKGKRFLKNVGGRSALQQMRVAQPRTPSQENWWWYIDEQLEAEQRIRRRGALRSFAIASAVLLVVTVLYRLFLMPDEATRMRYRYEQSAEQALMMGEPAEALVAVEEALTYAPDDGSLLLLRAVTLFVLDEPEQADSAFAEAMAVFEDETTYLSSRAQAYMIANRPDLALEDAERMIAIDESNAFAHFQAGNAKGSMGQYIEATIYYEKAGELARQAGQTELEGMARVQLANLMMLMTSPQFATGETTPTPTQP
jgi:tetratricopeptide (TPR) repeat protein